MTVRYARVMTAIRGWAVFAVSALVFGPALALAQPDPAALPRPSGCVLDRADALDASTVEAIQRECDRVASAGHELAVVVMPTAGPRGPAQYALDLFDAWRLGGPDDNDGVLLYAAIEDRAAEITLGDDLDTPANTARSDRVMNEVIVPAFRRGSPNEAMLEGARYAASNLFSAGPGGLVHPRHEGATEGRATKRLVVPSRRPYQPPAHVPARAYESPTFFQQVSGALGGYGLWVALGVLLLLLVVALRLILRYRPRKCEECGSPMMRFGEVEDDAHLSSAERKEEEVGSVDYDVWACQSCDHLIERRYAAIFTRYRTCDGCGARTQSSVSRTIQAATEHSTGLAEVTVSCAHCRRSSTHTRVIPRKPKPRQNSGGGSGFSSGGSSSFGGGGGGRSSGGGSSGRW